MLIKFFMTLKEERLPVSFTELFTLLECLEKNIIFGNVDDFYHLSRLCLIKDEKNFDKFDRAFAKYFENVEILDELSSHEIPNEWLRKQLESMLTDEEKAKIEALGGLDKLMEEFKKRMEEQKKRHQGGNKWIGTSGTSPFGSYGYNPEGIRIGQHESRHKRAVKVWDKREFKNFDSDIELGTRGMKIALKRLRRWARDGADEELDLENTITSSAKSGFIDVRTRPERRNAIKVIIFFDVGGSMDAYIRQVEELFSAARTAFKHLEYYYFHNCLYEGVWKNNHRRWTEQTPTTEVMNTYGKDYRCIFVGDASMSPYEIEYPGGANEHYNAESGRTWLERAITKWPNYLWINPTSKEQWDYTHSTHIIKDIFEDKMVPLTLNGLKEGMRHLS